MAVFRDRPSKFDDNLLSGGPSRAGRYGEAYTLPVSNKELWACDEGSYFVALTPTSGTGIIGHAAPTTFDETKPYIVLYNGGQNRIYPQFLELNETVAGVGGTGVSFTICTDTGNRYSSAGTALTVNNTNHDSINASGVTGYCGAVIATAATATRRNHGDIVFRGTTIDIIGDTYTIVFGAPSSNGGASSKVATLVDASRVAAPVCIGPGQSFLVHQWRASQSTGPTFQVRLGFIER